jgi:uncharacterized protein (TIGR02231 family)
MLLLSAGRCRSLGALFSLCLGLGFALPAEAWNPDPSQPAAAVFYPDEIQITVEESLSPETLPAGGTGFLLSVPEGVREETFLASVNGLSAGGYYWLTREERDAALAARKKLPVPGKGSLPENEASPERRALLEKLVPLADECARLEGELAGAEARLLLWQKSLERYGNGSDARPLSQESSIVMPSAADEADKLDISYKQRYAALYLEREQYHRALADAQTRLEPAQKALDDFDRAAGCELVAVPWSGPGKDLALRYSYTLPGSCRFSYRLTAYPDKEEIVLAQDADLTQHSGFAWEKVDLYLSTLRRDKTLRPRIIAPWEISLQKRSPAEKNSLARAQMPKPAPMQAAVANMANRSLAEAPGDALDEEKPSSPVQEEKASFRLWSLGKQRVEHNIPVRLALATDNCKAKFLYTLRPVSNPKGFLTAEISLPRALELPPGKAQFAVDDAVIGRQDFSFNGDRGVIFFGSDPQVTAVMRDVKQSSGEEGFFSKEETRNWHWRITLKNTRSKAVEVWLEDPVPDAVNEAVKVSVESRPAPEELVNPPEQGGAKIFRWKTTLKPGEPYEITHKVRLSAPQDKDLEFVPGR